jgi:hypothetical protein
MTFRTRHIRALLFGILIGGLGPGFLFFVTASGWIGWLTASLMTTGVAMVTVGVSLSLTNERENNQRNAWGVLTPMAGIFLMGLATGIHGYMVLRTHFEG